MFYRTELEDQLRVPPRMFWEQIETANLKKLQEKFDGFISKDFGTVIEVVNIKNIGDGVIVPGDGASYYKTQFELITFKPEVQEVVHGKIKDIADFGAFINLGPMDGMIHISQAMDDFVSLSKDKVLQGRDSKRVLKVNDDCRARIIAVSFKDIANPKIGVTMRQQGLGKLDSLKEAPIVHTEEEKKETKKKEVKKE